MKRLLLCITILIVLLTLTACDHKKCYHYKSYEQMENKTTATCTQDQSYDLVVYCKKCDAVLSSEHISLGPLDHDFVNNY